MGKNKKQHLLDLIRHPATPLTEKMVAIKLYHEIIRKEYGFKKYSFEVMRKK